MTPILWSDEVTIEIAAPPERVWALVSDVTRMGEWSPVCRTCEWVGQPAAPEVGARFVGYNRQSGIRWSRECVITASIPGRELVFHTLFRGAESTRWQYRFEPYGAGTLVAERYDVVSVPLWLRLARRLPGVAQRSGRDARRGMQLTLERLKEASERENSAETQE